MIYIIFGGFLMALADSIPGISGSTIAFILGFYEELIDNIDNLLHNNKRRKKSLIFFLKLGLGWLVGYVIAVIALTNLFSSHIYLISSLFIGLILASIVMIYFEEKACFKDIKNICYFIIGFALVILVSYFSMKGFVIGNTTKLVQIIYYFLSGIVAISAMLLPGISGSTVLLALGIYLPILQSLRKIMSLNFSDFYLILFLILGAIFAIIFVTKKIKLALEKSRAKIMYLIMGFMVASLYSVSLGPLTVNQTALSFENLNYFLVILGILLIALLHFGKKYHEKKI